MNRYLAASCLGLFAAESAIAGQRWEGHWEGTATRGGQSTPVVLDLGADSGTLGLPGLEVLGIPLSYDPSLPIETEFSIAGIDHGFEVSLKGDTLHGKWAIPEQSVEFDVDAARAVDSRPYTSQEITFHSDVRLAGTLFVPKTPGPHAGIALIHGSGDNKRWWRTYYADFFARQGLAVVFFDKRGNGESEGNWREAGFDLLADDGIAALEYLASRDDIRSDALGFWGISQAGWIMPLAATKSDLVSFMIVTSGATVNVEEEGYYDYLVRLKDLGYDESVQQQMLEILKLDNHVTRTGEGYEELQALVEPVRTEPWFKASDFVATPPAFVMRRFQKLILNHDPRPIIEQLDIPVLWIYGEADKSVEAPRSIGILHEIMKQGEYDFTIRTFPNADHGITVPPPAGAVVPKRVAAPGYWDAIADWLETKRLANPAE